MKIELFKSKEMPSLTSETSVARLGSPRFRSITFPQRKKKRQFYKRLFANCTPPSINDWEFNIFGIDKSTNGRSMFHVGLRILQDHGLVETFHLDIIKVMRCLSLIEDGYVSTNTYHNSIHAADVTQAIHCYLKEEKIAKHITPLEKLVAIFSALAHDVAHPGVNNAFLITTGSHLATLYNNDSVLENHHWRTAISIFHQTAIFDHLDKETVVAIETQSKGLILATDMAKQRNKLDEFKECLNSDNFCMKNAKNRQIVMQMALKCADLSNTTRAWHISSNWSNLICEEFFKQGDIERKLGLPVASLNDRHKMTVPQIQTGFMQFVVLPLLNEWKCFNPSELTDKMIQNVQANIAEWEAIKLRTKTEPQSISGEDNVKDTCIDTKSSASNLPANKKENDDLTIVCSTNDHNSDAKRPTKRSYSIPFGKNYEQTNNHMQILQRLQQKHDNANPQTQSNNNNSNTATMTSQSSVSGRRNSLPVSMLTGEDGGSCCDHMLMSNHLTALQTFASLRYSRRGSLPLLTLLESGRDRLEVLQESPTAQAHTTTTTFHSADTATRTLEPQIPNLINNNDAHTTNERLRDVISTATTTTAVDDEMTDTEDEHNFYMYLKKRRCSAPITKCTRSEQTETLTAGMHATNTKLFPQLKLISEKLSNLKTKTTNLIHLTALLSRRNSLPLKLTECDKLYTKDGVTKWETTSARSGAHLESSASSRTNVNNKLVPKALICAEH